MRRKQYGTRNNKKNNNPPVGGGQFFEQGIQPKIFLGTYEPQARDIGLGGLMALD